jgi:predicted MFS family arabinose efflux permease
VFSFYDVLFNVAFVAASALGALVLPSNGKSYGVVTTIAVGYALTAVGYATVAARNARRTAVLAETQIRG